MLQVFLVSGGSLAERTNTHLHCASQPCSVTAPVSSETVVSGNFWPAHGFPGEVLKSSSSSSLLRAPSRSYAWSIRDIESRCNTDLVVVLEEYGKELIAERTQLNRAVVRHFKPNTNDQDHARGSSEVDILGVQEALCEPKILAVAELPQHRPRCLQSATLDEDGVQIQKAGFGEPIITDTALGVLSNHVLDALELLRL